MNSRQFRFWTDERQEELWNMVSPNPTRQIKQKAARKFKKQLYEIIMVYSAIGKRKKHPSSSHVNEQGIKVTIFAPAYAYGVTPDPTAKTHRF